MSSPKVSSTFLVFLGGVFPSSSQGGWAEVGTAVETLYVILGFTFSPADIISTFLVTHSYKQAQAPAFKLSKYNHVIDFPPLQR